MAEATKIDPIWAWSEYKPTKEAPWNLKRVGHLYRRAAFGANYAELQNGLKNGPKKSIDALLRGTSEQMKEFESTCDFMAKTIAEGNNAEQLSAWGLYRMLLSPHPLREKMTLFWHDHFATSNAKVANAGYMIQQHRLMYGHALGNFADLLRKMSYDPAMMIWLDTKDSKKGAPNENYARELMELFSLGIGNYTEADIREAARAFTGWLIHENKPVFVNRLHDATEKKVLGQKGNWKPDDIVRICLEQKSAPYFIVGKLYHFLISETEEPTQELLKPLADSFRKDWDFGKLVERMIRSNLFFSESVYRTSVKSPIDFSIGVLRALECKSIQATALTTALEELGQRVFYPPSVAGWDGGPSWLNGQTLLFRQNLALALTSTEDGRFLKKCDPAPLPTKYGKTNDLDVVNFFVDLFLQGDISEESRNRLVEYQKNSNERKPSVFATKQDQDNSNLRALCHLVLTQPEFQLD